jgi:hypothetical protein
MPVDEIQRNDKAAPSYEKVPLSEQGFALKVSLVGLPG